MLGESALWMGPSSHGAGIDHLPGVSCHSDSDDPVAAYVRENWSSGGREKLGPVASDLAQLSQCRAVEKSIALPKRDGGASISAPVRGSRLGFDSVTKMG
jgi:hypothetical protein